MPRGVYERSPERIEQMTKTLVEWNKRNRIGVKVPRDIVEKQRASRLEYWKDHEAPNKDVPHSEATKERISKAMRRYWANKKQERSIIVS